MHAAQALGGAGSRSGQFAWQAEALGEAVAATGGSSPAGVESFAQLYDTRSRAVKGELLRCTNGILSAEHALSGEHVAVRLLADHAPLLHVAAGLPLMAELVIAFRTLN